eukprot:1195072-Prorocentrum_minimum.AAC.2
MDQSDAVSAGMFSRWTNRTHEARVYSHDTEPKCEERWMRQWRTAVHTDQSDAVSVGIFSRWTIGHQSDTLPLEGSVHWL